MLEDETVPESTNEYPNSDSVAKAQSAIESLTPILASVPSGLSSSDNPALSLLHCQETASQISSLLRQPDSGGGDNNLCRWLYDTFQTSDPDLKLVVLRFLPVIAGLYLSRAVALRKPLAGFEAVLLALYSHETTARASQSITVNVPDIVSHSSIYHEVKPANKNTNNATGLNLAIISPSIEPHGTVRSTRRARIVGVALELYYSKISQMPISSKLDFCEFCVKWAWELLQPVLRILGHCLLGPKKDKELNDAACAAIRSIYARSLHEVDSRAILATESLLKLAKMILSESKNDFDPTEIPNLNVISL